MSDFLNDRNDTARPFVCVDLPPDFVRKTESVEEVLKQCDDARIDAVNVPLYRTAYLISLVHRSQEAERYREAELDKDTVKQLEARADDHGLILSATVYDPELLDWYDRTLRAPYVSFHGGDITYRRLLETVAETSKTPVLSTAATTKDEIEQALGWLNTDPVLLHEPIVTESEADTGTLGRCNWLAREFDVPVGLRDGTVTVERLQPILGSLDLWMPQLAADPSESGYTLDELKSVLDRLESAEGSGENDVSAAEGESDFETPAGDLREYHKTYRRSLMAKRSLSAGQTLSEGMVREMRPGNGLPADRLKECLGILVQRPTDPQEMIAY